MYGMNTFRREESVYNGKGYWFMKCIMENLSRLIVCYSRIKSTFWISSTAIVFCCVIVLIKYFESSGSLPSDLIDLAFLFLLLNLVSGVIACSEERQSFRVMNSFRKLYPQHASVIREGKKVRIHEKELVVGDLVLLKAGSKVPADIRITEAWDLKVNQRPVICNSAAVPKSPECTNKDPTCSQNVVFYSSICVTGYGQGIAIATGERTAFGQMLKKAIVLQKLDTPLYREMQNILFFIGVFTAIISFIFFNFATLRNFSWIILLVNLLLAQVLSSVPDILHSAITASLYKAAKGMVYRHCLPKNYEAIEKLSSISVICCDMTGTITQNRMTVVEIFLDGKMLAVEPSEDRSEINLFPNPNSETWEAFTRAASLCSTIASKSRRNRCVIKKGCSCDQVEVAIMEFLNNTAGKRLFPGVIDYTRNQYKKVFEIPFNTDSNYHITIHAYDSSGEDRGWIQNVLDRILDEDCTYIMYMKGAVEVLLKFCSTALIDGREVPIQELNDENFQTTFQRAMRNGERLIGFCDYKMPKEKYPLGYPFKDFDLSDIHNMDFRFLGFVSIMDPPRASIPAAVAKCKKVGIKVILMTSDHPTAGKAIAKEVGIISSQSETVEDIAQRLGINVEEVPPGHARAAVLSGVEVQSREKDLPELLKDYDELVFARIYPDQKRQVVRILQSKGERVAVTGNSLEDAIAMHQADIGIGMGMHGTDLSREVADVILLGDNFESIVGSIVEGRLIYENLRKAIAYVLSSNIPKILPAIIVCIFFIPFTIGPSFILFITLIAEILPVIYLTKQDPDVNVMEGRRFDLRNFFDHRLINKSYWCVGMLQFLAGFFVYFIIMAQSGFWPNRIIGLARRWDSSAVNDLVDSYGQEWTFSSRKSLEYTSQTAFFVSIILMQCCNFILCRTHVYKIPKCKLSKTFCITSICIPGAQLLVIMFLMYTPYVSEAFHFFPLKITDWLFCFPFAILLLILEELRRFFLRNSKISSWLESEIF